MIIITANTHTTKKTVVEYGSPRSRLVQQTLALAEVDGLKFPLGAQSGTRKSKADAANLAGNLAIIVVFDRSTPA